MATQIEKKMQSRLNELYANEGRITRLIEQYQNQLVDDDLAESEREGLEKLLTAETINLEKIKDEIDEINGEVNELKEKENDAKEHKWKDIVPLLEKAQQDTHMSYCVESNKFIYCMDMASDIVDEVTGERYTVMNPQFRQFEGNKVERVVSKLINKFLSDSSFRIIKWFMTNNKTHFQETASFLYTKWSSDKVYNKARVISHFWAEPDFENQESYNKDFDTLLYSVGGGKQENIDHLEQWVAYKYLFPERVANTPNLDICGPTGANGKGRYLELCKTIFTYGCVTPATSKELSDGFNASWEMSTIIYFDEPTEKELPINKVKNATGGEEQRIEKKGVDAYTADRNYSMMAISNNLEGVFRLAGTGMAGQDRRFSVISTDIVLIDEIMRRENCTFEQATIRVNQIAQLVKDRKEVRKWLAHVIIKHNVIDMKILNPLHGVDYHKRFEDQKDTVQQVFDCLLPTITQCGVITIDVLQQAINELANIKHVMTPQKVKNRFQQYLDQNKIKYEYVKNTRINLLYNGEIVETLQKHHYKLENSNTNFGLDYSMFSNMIPGKGKKLTQQDFTIQI